MLPPDFITPNGFGIIPAARRCLTSLIQGEAHPPFKNGLPGYVKLRNTPAPRLERNVDLLIALGLIM